MLGMLKHRKRIQGANQPNPPGEPDVVLFASETTGFFDDNANESGSLTLPQIRGAAVGETVHVGFVTHGYKVSDRGHVSLVIDIRVLGPGGEPVIEEYNWSRYTDKAPEEPSFLFMTDRLDLTLELDDPGGDYTILATVRDLVSGKYTTGVYSLYVIQTHELKQSAEPDAGKRCRRFG